MKLLKVIREKHRFSLRQLGEAISKSPSYLGEIERGTRRPTPETLAAIASKLGHRDELFLEAGMIDPEIEKLVLEESFYGILMKLSAVDAEKKASFLRIASKLL